MYKWQSSFSQSACGAGDRQAQRGEVQQFRLRTLALSPEPGSVDERKVWIRKYATSGLGVRYGIPPLLLMQGERFQRKLSGNITPESGNLAGHSDGKGHDPVSRRAAIAAKARKNPKEQFNNLLFLLD
jgi:hypothetical protein